MNTLLLVTTVIAYTSTILMGYLIARDWSVHTPEFMDNLAIETELIYEIS